MRAYAWATSREWDQASRTPSIAGSAAGSAVEARPASAVQGGGAGGGDAQEGIDLVTNSRARQRR